MSTVKEEHAAATNILLRKQVNTLRERIRALSKTNSKLKQQSRVSEKDTNDFVEYFQNEINFLNEKNLELQAQIAMLVKESKDYRERSQREHAEVVEALKAEAQKVEASLKEKILSLTAQLEDVDEFRKEKSFMLDQLETLRSSLVSNEEKKREEIASLERKFLEEKQRMQGDYDHKIVQVEKTAAEMAMKKLDRKVGWVAAALIVCGGAGTCALARLLCWLRVDACTTTRVCVAGEVVVHRARPDGRRTTTTEGSERRPQRRSEDASRQGSLVSYAPNTALWRWPTL